MIRTLLVSSKTHERQILKDYFARLEYDPSTPGEELIHEEMETCAEAIDLLTSLNKDGKPARLVICADKLGDGSGLDLAKKIVENPNLAKTAVILFAKKMTAELTRQMKKAGVKEVIILPFSMESFRDSITRIVNAAVAKEDTARKEKLSNAFAKGSNMELEVRLRHIYSESLKALSEIQLLAPWSLDVALSKAKIYCGQNDFKAALPLLKNIASHDHAERMAQELLMLCYKRLGKAYEDSGDLKLLVQQNPWSSTLNQRFGEIMMSEGNYDGSIIFLRKAIDLYKKTIVTKRKTKQDKKLADTGERKEELAMHSGLVSTYFNLITAYKKMGKESMAADALEEVSRISPQTPEEWLSMFQAYLSSGDFSKAKYSFNKAIAENRDNQEFILIAAESYIRQGNYEEALGLFEKLGRLNPSDVRIYNFIGICTRHLHKYEDSVDAYKKALGLDPSDASIHFNQGSVLEDMGYLDKALASFNEAKKLDPTLLMAATAIKRVEEKINLKGRVG